MTNTNTIFQNVTTLEELKQEYKRLAMLHHPDLSGDTSSMQAINSEYDRLLLALKEVEAQRTKE